MIDAVAKNSGTAQPNQQPNPTRHVHVQQRRQAGVFAPTGAVASGRPSATEQFVADQTDGKQGRQAITASRLFFSLIRQASSTGEEPRHNLPVVDGTVLNSL